MYCIWGYNPDKNKPNHRFKHNDCLSKKINNTSPLAAKLASHKCDTSSPTLL